MKHTTFLATFLLMAGCVASPESYLAAHPETPSHIASSMRRGDVVAGMTREQVRLIWGMPDSKAEWSEGDSWAYVRSGHGGTPRLPEWGATPVKIDDSTQDQTPPSSPPMVGGKPRRMVYFRGDQVVLVEKAAGEL